jgi:3alpha(or 20beta)-hydroxysteroid dehydrogenase
VDELRAREGRLDVLVNNAAVVHLSAIDDTPLDTFETVLRVNCVGPFLGTRSCLPLLREARGAIVNVGSVNSLHAFPGSAGYTASKFALRGLTRVTALENGRHGVRANLVCPLMGNPEMHTSVLGPRLVSAPAPGARVRPFPNPPGGRSRGPADVAGMVVFLASDEALACTGADFVVDLGLSAGSLFDIPGVRKWGRSSKRPNSLPDLPVWTFGRTSPSDVRRQKPTRPPPSSTRVWPVTQPLAASEAR